MAEALNFYDSEDVEAIAACFTDSKRIDRSVLQHQLNMAALWYFSIRQQTEEGSSSSERERKFKKAYKHLDVARQCIEHIPPQPSLKQRTLVSTVKHLQKVLGFFAGLSDEDLALVALASKDQSFDALDQHLADVKSLIADVKSLMDGCIEEDEFNLQFQTSLHALTQTLKTVLEILASRKSKAGAKEPDWAFDELLIELKNIFHSHNVSIDNTKLSMEITNTDKPTFYYHEYTEAARGLLGRFFQACFCPLYKNQQWGLRPLERQIDNEALLTVWKRLKRRGKV